MMNVMTDQIAHRGPDGRGVYTETDARLALGHRRLAILDLSPHGRQPMTSAGGRYVIVFNGEIFNFVDLRKELQSQGVAPIFRGHSDTEILLACIEAWGVRRTVVKLVGMFAFVVWDRQERQLILVRDRLGIKPLYYGCSGKVFLFASELKALRPHPAFDKDLSIDAVALYMRYGYVPAPLSIYQDIFKLDPGTVLTITAPTSPGRTETYWSARTIAQAGVQEPFEDTDVVTLEALEDKLRSSVKLRMVADVPLGAFLSGGIDSSLVVALMQACSTKKVKTFSIGMGDPALDEAGYAAAVARHLGTDHTELYASPQHAIDLIPRMPTLYDEPFADSSQIPTFLVSALARNQVTVALSGDGGDELFGGYNRHVWGPKFGALIQIIPRIARQGIARAATSVAPATWDKVFESLGSVAPSVFRHMTPGSKLHKLAGALNSKSGNEFYDALRSQWNETEQVVVGSTNINGDHLRQLAFSDLRSEMMYQDLVTYLPDDILVKVDRASMAVSLEARVPLLDHRLVEFAWRLPMRMKVRGRVGKWALRQVLSKYVPTALTDRPKGGFGIPIGAWLRGPLREWAEELLSPQQLTDLGLLSPLPVVHMWREHLSGRRNHAHALWTVLMLHAWAVAQRESSQGSAKF